MGIHVKAVERAVEEAAWKFRVGQCVTGACESMPSLVVARCKVGIADGGEAELYRIRPYHKSGPWKDRTAPDTALKDVTPGEGDCRDCLLATTGLCPGMAAKGR